MPSYNIDHPYFKPLKLSCSDFHVNRSSVSQTQECFVIILQRLLIRTDQRHDFKKIGNASCVGAGVGARARQACEERRSSWRDRLRPPVSLAHVELERVGGSSRVSGQPHTARTAKKCTSEEEEAASQLGLPPSILFKFSLNAAVKKPLSILMINP